MSEHFRTIKRLLIPLSLMTISGAIAQTPDVRTDVELETFLAERANLNINMPDAGYIWDDSSFTGSTETGTLSVSSTRVIYYFLHWGPIEVPAITEDYVRERIPEVWPGEGLQVLSVKDTVVAGHPAFFAEVLPQRDVYRAFFVIWNCPESGRQFIADMNYNIRYRTPREELEAELATTYHTVACHVGADTEELPTHVALFDSPRFELSFHHPLHWYVMESPYGVPHPDYRGRRNRDIGSLLAHLQDRTTDFFFKWESLPEQTSDDTLVMGSVLEHYRSAIATARGMDQVDSFEYGDAETVTINGLKVFKLFGDVVRKSPEQPDPGFVPDARALVVLIDNPEGTRRLQVVILIDEYEVDGIYLRPARDIFDRWATNLSEEIEL
jgi:hypothetical protein